MELQYIVTNIKEHFGQPYLLKHLDELNIISYAMEKNIVLRYTTYLINWHKDHKIFNAVCKSTVYIVFLRIQPYRRFN